MATWLLKLTQPRQGSPCSYKHPFTTLIMFTAMYQICLRRTVCVLCPDFDGVHVESCAFVSWATLRQYVDIVLVPSQYTHIQRYSYNVQPWAKLCGPRVYCEKRELFRCSGMRPRTENIILDIHILNIFINLTAFIKMRWRLGWQWKFSMSLCDILLPGARCADHT